MHVKLIEQASQAAVDAGTGSQEQRFGPALVGSGPLWLRGCRQVEVACASGEWLSLEGEPGVGKLALLRAVHRRRNPVGAFHVLDAAEAGDQDWMMRALSELLEGEGSLVIRHVDRLSAVRLQALRIALEQALAAGRQQVLWVAVTFSPGPVRSDLPGLLQSFPGAVELPPLRHHIEDLHELVPFFLARLNPHGPRPAHPRRCICCCGRTGRATSSNSGRSCDGLPGTGAPAQSIRVTFRPNAGA